ncbi:MAG: hypothetical protein IJN42_04625 [Clostridia bacterium]|nr:hypothetical protein [Clostridia bacterium]
MAKNKKKGNWEKEDKLLDYIAGHKKEILRYLVVVLVGEVLRWGLGVLCAVVEPLLPFQTALTFLCWGLPYFIVCKLWVWEQRGDSGYLWAMQSLKFIMTILAVALLTGLSQKLLAGAGLGDSAIRLLSNMLWEILYFVAMLKFVLTPQK